MLVIAHRGNNKESFENSFTAYEKSVACGATRIELDVMLTKDGHAVINHDDHLLHTTGRDLYCSKLTRAEFNGMKQSGGEPVPFLDDIVERFLSRIELNIEIKGNNPESAKAVAKIIGTHTLRDKIIVSSFFPESLLYMRDHYPDIRRACLTGDEDVPWPNFSHLAILNFMQMTDAKIVHPRMQQISEAFMEQCHHRGWQVFTWAPMKGEEESRESWWALLKGLGVHGHCTNYPSEMIQWLKEEENYENKVKRILSRDLFNGGQHAY